MICIQKIYGFYFLNHQIVEVSHLWHTYIQKVESRAVFSLSKIRKNHILGLIPKRSSLQNGYFQTKADKNKLPMNAFLGWQIILVKQRFNVKLLWCYNSASLLILPYHNISKGKTDPRAECCCDTNCKQATAWTNFIWWNEQIELNMSSLQCKKWLWV